VFVDNHKNNILISIGKLLTVFMTADPAKDTRFAS